MQRREGRWELFSSSHPEWAYSAQRSSWSVAALFRRGITSPYDIMYIFGISYSEVLTSVWTVVDAIHRCSKFNISYPDTVEEQREIAAGFQAASTPGIRNCAGAIDGILIWMLKPSLKEAKKSGVDQKKFLCGRAPRRQFGVDELPRTTLFNMIVDGHWRRPIRNMRR